MPIGGSLITSRRAFSLDDYLKYLIKVAESVKCIGDVGHWTWCSSIEWIVGAFLSVLESIRWICMKSLSYLSYQWGSLSIHKNRHREPPMSRLHDSVEARKDPLSPLNYMVALDQCPRSPRTMTPKLFKISISYRLLSQPKWCILNQILEVAD